MNRASVDATQDFELGAARVSDEQQAQLLILNAPALAAVLSLVMLIDRS